MPLPLRLVLIIAVLLIPSNQIAVAVAQAEPGGHPIHRRQNDASSSSISSSVGSLAGANMTVDIPETEDTTNDQASSEPTPPPHAPAPHSGHNHGSHEAPKEILNEVGIHFWHKFPPTYLDADFKLDKDSAIFGEDFDADWDPEAANGHKVLMLFHVGAMMVAYFVALPICESSRCSSNASTLD